MFRVIPQLRSNAQVGRGYARAAAVALVAALACLNFLAPLALADPGDATGRVETPGMAPYSETWEQMVARDEADAGIVPDGSFSLPVLGSPPRGAKSPRSTIPARVRDLPIARATPGEPSPDDPEAPQTLSTNFNGPNINNSGFIPPDSMGAVGPTHFVVTLNGVVGIYNKSNGTLAASQVSLNSFFNLVVGGTTYPRNGASDPHVRFDRQSNRWFASTLEIGNPVLNQNHILLAVCRANNPITGTWDKYLIPVGVSGAGTDFDTFGLDSNGVYFGMTIFGATTRAKIASTGKSTLIAASPSLGTVFQVDNITDMFSSPQPAQNYDAVAATARAYFVASSTTVFGNLHYRTLTWSGGTPTLTTATILSTPGYGNPLSAPAMGSATNLEVGDDRLLMAMIRNNRLWTSRHVGVNSAGGATTPTRDGAEFLELNITNPAATLVQSARVFDTAAVTPRFYIYPSVAVSGQGHAALGFTGTGSTQFAGAYTAGRLSSDALNTVQAALQYQAGLASYQILDGARNRWGDYSYTSVDPADDQTLWTIQEYAGSPANTWVTRVVRLLAPAPTLNNPGASGCLGQTGLVVPLTGTGFYDPGAGFTNRLAASISGTGVTVTSVTYTNPTSASITVDVSAGAATGARNITLTNPDGQAVTVTNGFTVTSGVAATASNNGPVCTGGLLTLTGGPGGATTYSWTGPNVFSSNQQSPTVSNNATTAMAGVYTLTVTSGSCSGSAMTTVTVNTPPSISAHPMNQTVCPNTTAMFSVMASGSPAPTFQWRVSTNGGGSFSDIGGQTGSSYSFTAMASDSGNQYRCRVTNICGSIDSNAATLTSADTTAPMISQCAANAMLSAGASCQANVPSLTGQVIASDNCTASGSLMTTQSPLANTMVGLGNTVVTLTVTDASGNSSTCTATVTVNDTTPPTITTCAGHQTVAGSGDPCQASVPDFTGTPLAANDNCGPLAFTQAPAVGTLVGVGDTTITLTATDGAGLTATCTATLHVTSCTTLVTIVSASPPNGFRDPLENTTPALAPGGIGLTTPILVTFSGAPAPAPSTANIGVSCTDSAGNGPGDCPTVTSVSGVGAGPYTLGLSAAIPILECTTLTFAGTAPGVKLQYQFLPGDLNLNGMSTGQDVLALVTAINNGTANSSPEIYDVNRNGNVTGQDALRQVQLLNGTSATQSFNGAVVAACP